MTRPLVTPRWVWCGVMLEALGWCVLRMAIPNRASFLPRENALLGAFSALAYLLAFVLCLRIAAEYRGPSWMRFGWLALSGTASISGCRYLFDNYLTSLIWPGYANPTVNGVLRESFLLLEFLFLLTGVVCIWLAFRGLDLGLRLLTRDLTLMAVVVIALGVLIFERESLSEQPSGSMLAVGLQLSSHIVLGLAAVCSVPLHRLCVQMGGGRMAQFMRLIVAYTLLRSGAIFIGMIILGNGGTGIAGLLNTLAWRSTPWVFALAAVARSGIAAAVEREAARQELSEAAIT